MVPLENVASIIMGQSPKGDTYNNDRIGLPLLNGPTEFGQTYPICTLYTTNSRKESANGDLIFCVRGSTTGRMNWSDKKYSLGRGVCAIRGETHLDTRYIKYCLEYYLVELLQMAGGGTFPNLTKDTIHKFKIPFPDTRIKIASILSVYDDLIENNTHRIQILEEMAQRIYREWFVHFRFPGHENIKMVDSELGMIPEGWEVIELGDKIQFLRGKNITKNNIQPGDIPVVASGKNPAYYHNEANVSGPVVTISASGANAGYINLYHQDIWASDCSYLNHNMIDCFYFYFSLLKDRQIEITGLQRGSAQPHVYAKDLI